MILDFRLNVQADIKSITAVTSRSTLVTIDFGLEVEDGIESNTTVLLGF